jgi:RimJ/RimL family protein N-acetyltransferase
MSVRIDEIRLRDVEDGDLDILFAQQRDPAGVWMAGFVASDPNDYHEYMRMWSMIRSFESTVMRIILYNGHVAGDIVLHETAQKPGEPVQSEIGYWLGREFWGKGIATRGLQLFLAETRTRPLYARVLTDNLGSLRVLQKCGFRITGQQQEFANGRNADVMLHTLTLKGEDHGEP